MKLTPTTELLKQVYCKVETSKHCKALRLSEDAIGRNAVGNWIDDIGFTNDYGASRRRRISVGQFKAITKDRITEKRLNSDGVRKKASGDYVIETKMGEILISWRSKDRAVVYGECSDEPLSIKTYTELVELVRMVG